MKLAAAWYYATDGNNYCTVRSLLTPCGPADLSNRGGIPGPDGLLGNHDFVDQFFNGC